MNTYFVATQHRNLILQAMKTLMYAVGTPIPGVTSRKTCVYFRPRQKADTKYFKIMYGSGCSATVRNHIIYYKLYHVNHNIILQVGYSIDMSSTMTLNNPGCYYMGTIQHELMHILGKCYVL